jgi:hypothetical protein
MPRRKTNPLNAYEQTQKLRKSIEVEMKRAAKVTPKKK